HASRQLDRVDDFHVSGATAKMRAEPLGDLLARGPLVLLDQVPRANHDAWDAEAALHTSRHRERFAEDLALALGNAFECYHRATFDLFRGERARDLCLPVNQYGAAAALAGG